MTYAVLLRLRRAVGIAGIAAVAAGTSGCDLLNAKTFSYTYAFDPQAFSADLGESTGNAPTVPCSSSVTTSCAALSALTLQSAMITPACNTATSVCQASADVRLSYMVDLASQTGFPPDAIHFGISAVSINKIEYWISSNTLNVATPSIDLYVAPASAQDETQGAVLLGSVATLSAMSASCGDPADANGDTKANGATVCDLPLNGAGISALEGFAKNASTAFQILAHARFTIAAGEPIPAGAIDFTVRPSIDIGILK